jgi:hypothetical protein
MQEDLECDREFSINFKRTEGPMYWQPEVCDGGNSDDEAAYEIIFGNICNQLKYRSIFILWF